MREKFTAFLPEVNCFDTTGENTGLPEHSVDLITVAQAFHWLDAGLCFRSGHAGKHTIEEGDAFLRNEFFREVEVVSFDNPFRMNLHVFEGNMRSRSYALTPQDVDYNPFISRVAGGF